VNLIGRYLRREILLAVLFVFSGFLALFAFFDLINELEDVGRGGYKLHHAVTYVVLALPGHAYELMPIAALIGSIYALSQFAAQSEFTAMRAAGFSRSRAFGQMMRIGTIFALMTLAFGELLTPPAEHMAQRVRLAALGGSVLGEFRSGLWIKDTTHAPDGSVQRMRFVNVGSLQPDSTLKDIQVFEFDRDFRLQQILRASSGRFRPPDRWELVEIEKTDLSSAVTAGPGAHLARRVAAPARTGLGVRIESRPARGADGHAGQDVRLDPGHVLCAISGTTASGRTATRSRCGTSSCIRQPCW
jgi:lipopolysaccharide export system permease protein